MTQGETITKWCSLKFKVVQHTWNSVNKPTSIMWQTGEISQISKLLTIVIVAVRQNYIAEKQEVEQMPAIISWCIFPGKQGRMPREPIQVGGIRDFLPKEGLSYQTFRTSRWKAEARKVSKITWIIVWFVWGKVNDRSSCRSNRVTLQKNWIQGGLEGAAKQGF